MAALFIGQNVQYLYFNVLFYWVSASLFAVSIAYLFRSPAVFRKRKDGTIPFYIRWVFIPFLFGVQLYNAWARKNDKVPAIQKIADNLYLACRLFPSDINFLQEQKISAILDVTAEFDGLDWTAMSEGLDYLNIPVLDHQSPSAQQLKQAITWIHNHLEQNKGVVVHCALGRGRSVLVMAAYLLSRDSNLSVRDALESIQGVRTTAGLNKGQLRTLVNYHNDGLLVQQTKLALIANPVSGGGKWPENKEEILSLLTPHFKISVYETTESISAKQLAKKAVKEGNNVIVSCGGDGTVSEVASAVINSECTLGIIPMGTTNALSHVLHGTVSKVFPIDTSCNVIIQNKVKTIDTAQCNDEPVLLMMSIGFGQKMIQSADRDTKNLNGQIAYLKGLWGAVQTEDSLKISISLDDEPAINLETASLVVANAAPFSTVLAQGNGAPDIHDGLLDITCLPKSNSVSDQLVNLADLAVAGITQEQRSDQIGFNQAKKVTISAEQSIKYAIDGEEREAQQISISILPSSLKVLTNS